jgi:hypothetical protein
MGQAAGGIFDDGIKLLQSGVLLLDCDFEIVAEKSFDSLGVNFNHNDKAPLSLDTYTLKMLLLVCDFVNHVSGV